MSAMTRSLYFNGPRSLTIEEEPLRTPGPDEVVIEALVSGISAGTELNVFRGLAPQWRQHMEPVTRLFLDGGADWSWPARYGYAMVGRIVERFPVHNSAVVVVQIEEGGFGAEDEPLLYHERRYHRPSELD